MAALEGRKIKSLDRRGKYLLFRLDDGHTMVVHLGMSGQLLRSVKPREALTKHTHVVLTFTQGGQLRYFDARQFGECFVATPEEFDQLPMSEQIRLRVADYLEGVEAAVLR